MENKENTETKFGLPIEFVEQAKILGGYQKKSKIEEISLFRKAKALSAFNAYRSHIPNLKISEDQEYLVFGEFEAQCIIGNTLSIHKDKQCIGIMESISDLGEIFLNLEK